MGGGSPAPAGALGRCIPQFSMLCSPAAVPRPAARTWATCSSSSLGSAPPSFTIFLRAVNIVATVRRTAAGRAARAVSGGRRCHHAARCLPAAAHSPSSDRGKRPGQALGAPLAPCIVPGLRMWHCSGAGVAISRSCRPCALWQCPRFLCAALAASPCTPPIVWRVFGCFPASRRAAAHPLRSRHQPTHAQRRHHPQVTFEAAAAAGGTGGGRQPPPARALDPSENLRRRQDGQEARWKGSRLPHKHGMAGGARRVRCVGAGSVGSGRRWLCRPALACVASGLLVAAQYCCPCQLGCCNAAGAAAAWVCRNATPVVPTAAGPAVEPGLSQHCCTCPD